MSISSPSLLEIGPGRGDFLIHLARENPLRQIAAIESRRKRYDKLNRRLAPFPNVTLLFGDARQVLPAEFPEGSLEEVYILFSDPWPKRRHAKHRLFQPDFVRDLHHRLRPKGDVVVATDDPVYRREIIEQFSSGAPFRYRELDNPFPTFYAEKWREEGRRLYAFSFKKC